MRLETAREAYRIADEAYLETLQVWSETPSDRALEADAIFARWDARKFRERAFQQVLRAADVDRQQRLRSG